MNDYVFFYLVLAAVYLIECLFVIERGTIMLYSRWLKTREYAFLDDIPHFAGKVLFLCNPFPPLGENFSCSLPVMAASPEGVSSGSTHFLYRDIKNISCKDRIVCVNGAPFVHCSTAESAQRIFSKLKELAESPYEKRGEMICGMIAAGFDTGAAKKAYDDFKKSSLKLRIFSNALLLFFFPCVPMLVYLNLFYWSLPVLVPVMLVLMGIILKKFYSSHRGLYEKARGDRWSVVISMLFSPPLAVRSVDYLSKNLFERFHPIAAAGVLMEPEKFKNFSYRIMRGLLLSGAGRPSGSPEEISGWYNRETLNAIRSGFGGTLSEREALNPPPKENESILSYCPGCHAQFTRPGGRCSDCGYNLERYP